MPKGYAAGELKHGPIALDRPCRSTSSRPTTATSRASEPLMTLILPTVPATVAPLVYALPVQLIAYHTAVIMGTDVDQPRNLAKSVTVE